MRAIDGIAAQFTTQTNSPQVALMGGQYELAAACATYNSAVVTLERLLPDGTTWIKDTNMKLSANGVVTGYLTMGSYRLIVDTGTPSATLYASLSRIPTD